MLRARYLYLPPGTPRVADARRVAAADFAPDPAYTSEEYVLSWFSWDHKGALAEVIDELGAHCEYMIEPFGNVAWSECNPGTCQQQ